MTRLLHLHPGPDTGGQSVGSRPYLEAAGVEVRVLVSRQHPFGYGRATLRTPAEDREAFDWADVVVVHNDADVVRRITPNPDKPVIVHHHGTQFRSNPEIMWARGSAIGARQVVSTVDLLLSVPEGEKAEWMPQIVSLRTMALHVELAALEPRDRLVVTHAPTDKRVKGTAYIQRAMRPKRGAAQFDLIYKEPWFQCLARKARSDVFVDQLHLGYGNNAIEAWAMGLPVIAGAPERVLERMGAEWGALPFLVATPETVGARIGELIADPVLRRYWGDKGRAHVDRYHAPDAWVGHAFRAYGLGA